jgi:hypothetical protein
MYGTIPILTTPAAKNLPVDIGYGKNLQIAPCLMGHEQRMASNNIKTKMMKRQCSNNWLNSILGKALSIAKTKNQTFRLSESDFTNCASSEGV